MVVSLMMGVGGRVGLSVGGGFSPGLSPLPPVLPFSSDRGTRYTAAMFVMPLRPKYFSSP